MRPAIPWLAALACQACTVGGDDIPVPPLRSGRHARSPAHTHLYGGYVHVESPVIGHYTHGQAATGAPDVTLADRQEIAVAQPRALSHGTTPAGGAHALPSIPLDLVGGRTLDLAHPDGRWTWLYLGFASCPDLCPTTLATLSDRRRKLASPDQVRVVFVSLDPGRDTPEKLDQYVRYYDPSFAGATSNRANLDALVAALGTSYRIEAPAAPGGYYGVVHPNRLFLLDPTGKLVATYPADAAGLVEDFDGAPQATTEAQPSSPPAWCLPMGVAAPATEDPAPARTAARGSGTSLIPPAGPMRMWHFQAGDWLWMVHGSALAGYNIQGGPRGGLAWAAENWQMLMGTRRWGPGALDLRLMTSLEPMTLPPGGTPQLLQTGETYNFQPLIDRQHPHDLLMELAARYTWSLDDRTDVFLYGGPVAEPALGPPAYMHRPSAADNPWAPLGHHLQDSSHITFGAGTAGFRRGPWQLEGSVFNGREPDEYRYDVEVRPWTSYAGRLSYALDSHWTGQVSLGRLHNPEILHPGDVVRASASILTVQPTPWGPWSTQLVWGQNTELHTGVDLTFVHESYGLESQLDAGPMHYYGRVEAVDKDGLPPEPALNHTIRRVEALTLGASRELGLSEHLAVSVGGDMTLFGLDPTLKAVYGYEPFSFRVYMQLRPPTLAASPRQAP